MTFGPLRQARKRGTAGASLLGEGQSRRVDAERRSDRILHLGNNIGSCWIWTVLGDIRLRLQVLKGTAVDAVASPWLIRRLGRADGGGLRDPGRAP